MKVSTFVVASAAEAVAAVRAELGPDAVVVSVRQLPQSALGWFAGKPKLEVTACVPDSADSGTEPSTPGLLDVTLAAESPTGSAPKGELFGPESGMAADSQAAFNAGNISPESSCKHVLENLGLLPRYAEAVLERIGRLQTMGASNSFQRDLALARAVLMQSWAAQRQHAGGVAHIFIGPPGSGKTTALCKWLAKSTLVEGKSPRAWRLDGATANQAESLSVYCEILGVPILRAWTHCAPTSEEPAFIDLPGVNAVETESLRALALLIQSFQIEAQIHLVLNGAYSTPLLFKQFRAFTQALPITDLIFTHLDEETCWGKLWNFVVGTNCAIRFLSAGQNIPGCFVKASAEQLLPPWFPK